MNGQQIRNGITMDIQTGISHISQEQSKDLIIALLLDDMRIIEGWIRQHVNGDWHANDRALIIVADIMKDVQLEYAVDRIIKKYSALSNACSSARFCLNEYELRETINPEMMRLFRESIKQLDDMTQ